MNPFDDIDDLGLDLAGIFAGIDGPRPLPDDLREALLSSPAEHETIEALHAAESAVASRPLTAELRDRLLASPGLATLPRAARRTLVRRFSASQHQHPHLFAVAAAAVAVLLLAGTLAAAMEAGSRRPGPSGNLATGPVTTTTSPAATASDPATTTTAVVPPSPAPRPSPRVFLAPPPPPPPPVAPPTEGLIALGDCEQLLDHYRTFASERYKSSWSDSPTIQATRPADGTFSQTNVQEAGVDEPDTVKTDGAHLFVHDVAGRQLRSVAVGDVTATSTGSVALTDDGNGSRRELLLAGDRLLAVGTAYGQVSPTATWEQRQSVTTVIDVIDVHDPAAMRVLAVLRVEGRYVSARLVDGVVRFVVHTTAKGPAYVAPEDDTPEAQARADEENKRRIAASTLEDWVPTYTYEDRSGSEPVVTKGRLCDCGRTMHPDEPLNLSHVSVVTVDPADPARRESASVQSGAAEVYSSKDNLYVTSVSGRRTIEGVQAKNSTDVHRFSIASRKPPVYEGSGAVPGNVLGQYSLSEHEGMLRVASTLFTTTDAGWTSESFVSVLQVGGGGMPIVGQAGGLGQGERIYAVRFVGTLAYVVTFRTVDPLYVVDVSDPRRPVVAGELKIEGYSAYLHPMDPAHLIGVGVDIGEQGQRDGIQASVFDVGNPAQPTRTAKHSLGGSSSDVEFDPHAFLYWAPTGTTVIPLVTGGSPEDRRTGAAVLRVSSDRIIEQGRLSHDGRPANGGRLPDIRRSFVVGSRLYTVSAAGVLVNQLDTLLELQWLAF